MEIENAHYPDNICECVVGMGANQMGAVACAPIDWIEPTDETEIFGGILAL